MRRTITVSILATMLSFCVARAQQANTVKPSKQVEEDDIREAVIRYQMEGWARDGDKNEQQAKNARDKAIARQLNSHVFFVSVNGKDPSDEFLRRFQDIPRIIKKASEGKQTKSFPGWVVDKKTKQAGIIFRADEIQWTNDKQVQVDGGYHCGGLCAAGDVFTVEFEQGKWRVINIRMKWIS